jgi:glutathione S-transferase
MPILYCHHESGHCYKIALAMSLMGVAFEQRPVDLNRVRELRRADFREVARFDEVPVLVFEDGLAVCQSATILDTLAQRYGKLDGRSEIERVLVREWTSWEAYRLGMDISYLRLSRHFHQLDGAIEEWFLTRLCADLDRLNLHLQDRSFVAIDIPTIADVACCGFMFWAHQADVDLDRWPAVEAWLLRLRALPGWRAPHDLLEARYPILTGARA